MIDRAVCLHRNDVLPGSNWKLTQIDLEANKKGISVQTALPVFDNGPCFIETSFFRWDDICDVIIGKRYVVLEGIPETTVNGERICYRFNKEAKTKLYITTSADCAEYVSSLFRNYLTERKAA